MFAKNLISQDIEPLKTSDSGRTGLAKMNDAHVRHLPIVNHTQLLGVVSDDDILEHDLDASVGSYLLTMHKARVQMDDHLFEIMKVIGNEALTLLPVVDEENNYAGVISLQEVVRKFGEMAAFAEPGGVIVLEMQPHDYSMQEIARVIEGEQARILSLFVSTDVDTQLLKVMIKLDKHEITGVISTFSRLNYNVTGSYIENSFFDSLQDNYQNLMKFLDL